MPDSAHSELRGEFVLSPTVSHTHSHQHTSPAHFFSSFVSHPKGVAFQDQEENEDIILIIRRHFITNVPWIFTAILLSILPIFSPFLFQFFPFMTPSTQTQILLISFFYLIIFGFVLLNFTLWYFHIGIITNIRIRDIDIHGILYKDISETKNTQIEDVSYSQIGFIRSLFNYGDVAVQTAGSHPNIEFDKAPRPSEIARIIGDLIGNK